MRTGLTLSPPSEQGCKSLLNNCLKLAAFILCQHANIRQYNPIDLRREFFSVLCHS